MLPVPVSLSWDSLFASFFLGFSKPDRSHRYYFSAALGAFDALASWSAVHLAFTSPWWLHVGTHNAFLFAWILGVALCGILAMIGIGFRRPCQYALPILLCLDNLASPGASQPSFLSVLTVGLISAAMSALGFSLSLALKTPLKKFCCLLPPVVRLLP
jgi:hypothetical protein